MDEAVKRLAKALRLAERAHAQYELEEANGAVKIEWPEFYARWLLDNVHVWIGSGCPDGSCEVHHG